MVEDILKLSEDRKSKIVKINVYLAIAMILVYSFAVIYSFYSHIIFFPTWLFILSIVHINFLLLTLTYELQIKTNKFGLYDLMMLLVIWTIQYQVYSLVWGLIR